MIDASRLAKGAIIIGFPNAGKATCELFKFAIGESDGLMPEGLRGVFAGAVISFTIPARRVDDARKVSHYGKVTDGPLESRARVIGIRRNIQLSDVGTIDDNYARCSHRPDRLRK